MLRRIEVAEGNGEQAWQKLQAMLSKSEVSRQGRLHYWLFKLFPKSVNREEHRQKALAHYENEYRESPSASSQTIIDGLRAAM